MPARHRITCINKRDRPNPHERISHIGGQNADGTRWKLGESDAISGIRTGKWEFYVSVNGRTVEVVIAQHMSHDYLKTEADGLIPNNLLALPECS